VWLSEKEEEKDIIGEAHKVISKNENVGVGEERWK